MPFEAYIGYVADKDKEVEAGDPVVVEVRDLDTFERKIVRAVIAKPGQSLADSDQLWILDWVESRMTEPWGIRVLEELDPEEVSAGRSDISEEDLRFAAEESLKYGGRKYRGSQMPGTMGQEEIRKYYENLAAKPDKEKK